MTEKSEKTLQSQLRKAKRAMKLANGVMEYCGGDKWERECTQADRNKFNKIYKEIFGKEGTA